MKLILIATLAAVFVTVSARYTGPTNQAGVDLIKSFEGWYPNFYTDPVGIKTIGYGHACHVWNCAVPINGKYTPPLTQAQGNELLKSDLSAGGYESCVTTNAVNANLNAAQYSALVSFTFNLGCGSLKSSTLLSMVNSGNFNGASLEFAKWVHAGGVVLPGLVRRREAERVLFCSAGGCSASSSCSGTVEADSLIVRASPSTSSAAVASLYKGNVVQISSRTTGTVVSGNGNWFKISSGYVSAYFIKPSSGGPAWCSKT